MAYANVMAVQAPARVVSDFVFGSFPAMWICADACGCLLLVDNTVTGVGDGLGSTAS